MPDQVIINAKLTCPTCNGQQDVEMPTTGFQHFYKCVKCEDELTPKADTDCIFCSYADTPCPMKQQGIAPTEDPNTATSP
ncbi:MAG: GDCCVxC domain-containing (seleno)protein [Microgenomates group bacterium]